MLLVILLDNLTVAAVAHALYDFVALAYLTRGQRRPDDQQKNGFAR